MDRENFLLKRRIKYMFMLFLVFIVLIILFDAIVFTVSRNALYSDCDSQIIEAEEYIRMSPDSAVENFSNGKEIVYYDDGNSYVINYKIFLVLRDENGSILNSEYLKAFDYMLDLKFSPGVSGACVTEKVERNGAYLYYRTASMLVETTAGETYYVQLATDSSDIELSLSIITRVLLICTAVAMLMFLIVGWYLSKMLVRGVVEAWERQDEFISYASHEIRSPLAVIHSSLELLLEKPGAKVIDRSDLILNSLTETSRLRKMTNNLLEMVKLQASEMPLHEEKIAMKQMVEDFIEPFMYQAEATGKRLEYYVQDGLTMVADRQLLTELLVIFLENALKYTEEGDMIRVRIDEKSSNLVSIKVEDSGVGISDEGLEKVFTRFYREERQQAKSDGSGLGLYIAGLIVRAHGGKISAQKNNPKGTVFIATIKKNR